MALSSAGSRLDEGVAAGGARPPESTRVTVVDEVDSYMAAVRGIQIESVRTGQGIGPNRLLTTQGDGFVLTGVTTGFPLLGRTMLGEDEVALMVVRAAPAGANFCGIDLEPGMVLCYGPAAHHTGVNPVGYEFVFAVTTCRELAERAEALRRPFTPPPRGQVHHLAGTARVRALGHALDSIDTAADAGYDPHRNREDDLMLAAIRALADEQPERVVGDTHQIDNRHVVLSCVDYADAIGRMPTIDELCLVAHVSERRLRQAFTRIYGMPPARFFRTWGLDQARRRLRGSDPQQQTVTEVAADLGFAHLGRFSGRYAARFGEAPSETLAYN